MCARAAVICVCERMADKGLGLRGAERSGGRGGAGPRRLGTQDAVCSWPLLEA